MYMKSVFFNEMETFDLPSDFIDSVMKIGGVDNIALLNLAYRILQAGRKEIVSAGTFCKQFFDEVYCSHDGYLKGKLVSDNKPHKKYDIDPLYNHFEMEVDASRPWMKLVSDVMPFRSSRDMFLKRTMS